MLAALVAGAVASVAVDDRGRDVWRLVFTALLGLPFLFALALTAERRRWSTGARAATAAGAGALLAVLWFAARDWPDTLTVTRYIHLAVAFHLLVAVLPFAGRGSLRGFWQFNRIIFLRFLLASLYSAVLFIGLAVALLAVDNLFGIHVDEIAYQRLWVLLAFVFHPWFFLAGVPENLDALDTLQAYPVGLKVFAQFVLVPLVSVYVLILSAYLVRVIVTRTWPSGWIGWLVSSVAAAGTLALLLVHPVRERADARWVDAYARWFYAGLLPSIGMLLMAIGLRLGQYGFTERRYFLLVLAVWLTGVALFYAITGSRNIRIIPATLAAIALLTFMGPWSAYAVSRRDQADRLRTVLERTGHMPDGPPRPTAAELAIEDVSVIEGTVYYLIGTHGPRSLAAVHPSLAEPAAPDTAGGDSAMRRRTFSTHAGVVFERLGIDPLSVRRGERQAGMPFHHVFDELRSIDVAGWDVLVRTDVAKPQKLPVGGDTLRFSQEGGGRVRVRWRDRDVGTLRFDSLVANAPAHVMPQEPPVFDLLSPELRLRVVLRSLVGVHPRAAESLQVGAAEADVLIDIR